MAVKDLLEIDDFDTEDEDGADHSDLSSTLDPQVLEAKKFVEQIGRIPQYFSSRIRTIINAKQIHKGKNVVALKEIAIDQLSQIVNQSDSLKVIYFLAAKKLYPHKLENKRYTPEELLELFDVGEMISIFGLVILLRRVRRLCDATEWPPLFASMQQHLEFGLLVGRALPGTTSGEGLLVGGIRHLSLGCFLAKDKNGFRDHQKHLKKQGKIFDIRAEEKRWKCNHLQIASLLALQLGFGLTIGSGLLAPLSSVAPEEGSEFRHWFVLVRLAESLHQGASPFANFDIDEWFPDRALWVKCKGMAQDYLKGELSNSWIGMNVKDVDPQVKALLNIRSEK